MGGWKEEREKGMKKETKQKRKNRKKNRKPGITVKQWRTKQNLQK